MTDRTPSPRSDRTFNAILDSAYALFTAQGYAATSMRQIAEGAGLALGGIYNHFESKEHIFQTIVLTRHPVFKVLPIIETIQATNPDEFIRTVATTLVRELAQHREFVSLLLIELVEFNGRHAPLLLQKLMPDLLNISNRLTQLQPKLRPIPPLLMVRAFVGMFISYVITEMLVKDLMPPELEQKSLDTLIDIFLYGIVPGGQPSLPPGSPEN